MGIIADAFEANMRELAASDARLYRGLDQHLRTTRQLLDEAEQPMLPASTDQQIADAVALLEAHGYRVTR